MLSIVITIFNDAESIPPLIDSVLKTVSSLKLPYELVLVDDHSVDNSREIITHISHTNNNIKAIFLSRNYGQQIAMSAGINTASGDFIIIMDGDLQNPPEKIIDLYFEAKKGFDIVYCISNVRNGLLDKVTSQSIWFILKFISESKFSDFIFLHFKLFNLSFFLYIKYIKGKLVSQAPTSINYTIYFSNASKYV